MLNTVSGSSSLPREVLQWVDTLDLSYAIRNPRMDLANGFLVAEILTRKFPSELSILTFYNAQRKDHKIDNWQQIQKCTSLPRPVPPGPFPFPLQLYFSPRQEEVQGRQGGVRVHHQPGSGNCPVLPLPPLRVPHRQQTQHRPQTGQHPPSPRVAPLQKANRQLRGQRP